MLNYCLLIALFSGGLEVGAHPVMYNISYEEKQELLKAHNLFRSDAAVRFDAADMQVVVNTIHL